MCHHASPSPSYHFNNHDTTTRRPFGDDVVPGERRISSGTGSESPVRREGERPSGATALSWPFTDRRRRDFHSPRDEFFTDGSIKTESVNLPDSASWVQETLDGDRLDSVAFISCPRDMQPPRRSASRCWSLNEAALVWRSVVRNTRRSTCSRMDQQQKRR